MTARLQASFTVEVYDLGILVNGPVPVDALLCLYDYAAKRDLDRFDIGIATATGASFCFTSEAKAKAWRAQIEAKNAHLTPLEAWLAGPDTGISSRTIVHVLTGAPLANGRADVPHDPSDLGRCLRLLDTVPGLRERLPEVADRYPEWRPLVEHWDELAALYHTEAPTGRAPKTWARMRELMGETR